MGNPLQPEGFTFRNLTIREPVPSEIESVARRLRKADIAELAAGPFADWKASDILKSAVACSDEAYVAVDGDTPVFLFGFGPAGDIWMMGTPLVRGHALALVDACRWLIGRGIEKYGVLKNVVYGPNRLHVRFLEHLGASFGPPLDNQFIPFTIQEA